MTADRSTADEPADDVLAKTEHYAARLAEALSRQHRSLLAAGRHLPERQVSQGLAALDSARDAAAAVARTARNSNPA